MREQLELHAKSALVVFSDAELELRPPEPSSSVFKRYFVELARGGAIFFLDGEDPRRFRLLIAENDDLADLPAYRYARLSGSFRLALPTGRLTVSDGGKSSPAGQHFLAVAPGDYAVTVHGVDMQDFDAAAYKVDQRRAVGEADWRYRGWVSAARLVGLLVLLASCAIILIYRWSMVSLVAAAFALLGLAPQFLMSRTARYRESSKRLTEFENRHPQFALKLQRVSSSDGVAGGYYTV